MRALAADPRWAGTHTRWTFWAITYDLDDYGVAEINQPDRPRGRIDTGPHHTAWLRTWGSLLEDCRARLEYLRQALELETKKEAGVRHLQDCYANEMPEIIETTVKGRMRQASVKRTRAKSGTPRRKKRKPSPAADVK